MIFARLWTLGLKKTKITKERRSWQKDKKHTKNVFDARGNVQRSRVAYEQTMKETDLAKDALVKAEKDEVNQPENKKLQPITKKAAQRYAQSAEKGRALDSSYKSAVTKANEETDTFHKEHMPAVLDQLQKWEEDRWKTLIGSLQTFKSIRSEAPLVIEEQLKELNSLIEASNMGKDFKEFIDANKKEVPATSTLEYVPYKSKYADEEKGEEKSKEKEAKPKEENSFSTQTAEEKLAESNQQVKESEPKENKKEQDEEEQKKTAAIKQNLFGKLGDDDEESIFK